MIGLRERVEEGDVRQVIAPIDELPGIASQCRRVAGYVGDHSRP